VIYYHIVKNRFVTCDKIGTDHRLGISEIAGTGDKSHYHGGFEEFTLKGNSYKAHQLIFHFEKFEIRKCIDGCSRQCGNNIKSEKAKQAGGKNCVRRV
jgi:hypothetical protein